MQTAFPFYQKKHWTPYRNVRSVRIMPETIARRRDLTSSAKQIYTYLIKSGGEGGKPTPAHETIARACGLSPATVKRGLDKLRRNGLISWRRRSGCRGNRYYFHQDAVQLEPPKIAHFDGVKIAHSAPPREVRLREEERPSGRSPEPARADEVRGALEAATGKSIADTDSLPGKFLGMAERAGGDAESLTAWIEEKTSSRGRSNRIHSPGFFLTCFGEYKRLRAKGMDRASVGCGKCGRSTDCQGYPLGFIDGWCWTCAQEGAA